VGNFLTRGETISFLLEVRSSTTSDRRNKKEWGKKNKLYFNKTITNNKK
jgi:hypothetical protein